ncbi:MAG: hypothetical protein ACLP5H_13610 [Desulfomonilaceae bacterium]
MRLSVGIIAAACLFILVCDKPARGQKYDVGIIEQISEGNIYVRGNYGLHVLETLGSCLWCEVGLEVIVSFEGFTRAKLSPYSESIRGRPVRVFVVKDGREEG